MLPEVGGARLVQSAIKNLQEVVPIGAVKGVQPKCNQKMGQAKILSN